MTRFGIWSLALALGFAGWLAIVELLGWWVLAVLAYLYLLAIAAAVSIGGINAALLWLERRRR